ncbi:MAG: type II secretion system protein N [Sphingomonadaceae bacterium]
MKLALDPRAMRWLRRVPGGTVYSVVEIALVALVAIVTARLLWVIVTPLGPVGDWRAARSSVAADPGVWARFDPFNRLGGAVGPAVVTSLSVQLFGVRLDSATGQGSAILAGPDGVQQSFVVGDAIVAGVTLKAVRLDGVTLDRGGAEEQVYLDQSGAAPVAAPGGLPDVVPAVAGPGPAARPPARLAEAVAFAPYVQKGSVTGLVLQPQGDGEAFRAAGLQPGDVLKRVNGQPISGGTDVIGQLGSLAPDAPVKLEIERAGKSVSLTTKARP